MILSVSWDGVRHVVDDQVRTRVAQDQVFARRTGTRCPSAAAAAPRARWAAPSTTGCLSGYGPLTLNDTATGLSSLITSLVCVLLGFRPQQPPEHGGDLGREDVARLHAGARGANPLGEPLLRVLDLPASAVCFIGGAESSAFFRSWSYFSTRALKSPRTRASGLVLELVLRPNGRGRNGERKRASAMKIRAHCNSPSQPDVVPARTDPVKCRP